MFVRTLIITVLAAVAAPSLAEELMRSRTSHAKAAAQIDSGGDASSISTSKETATPDIAKHQQGDHLMRKRTSMKDAVRINSDDTSNQVRPLDVLRKGQE